MKVNEDIDSSFFRCSVFAYIVFEVTFLRLLASARVVLMKHEKSCEFFLIRLPIERNLNGCLLRTNLLQNSNSYGRLCLYPAAFQTYHACFD